LTDGMPASRLGRQIAEIAAVLNALGIPFALIGGLALASHKVVRATQDVDLLVAAGRERGGADRPGGPAAGVAP